MKRSVEPTRKAAIAMLESWYDGQRSPPSEEPQRYVIAAALAVLERFPKRFPLAPDDYLTPRSQVRTSGSLIKTILGRHGEGRTFSREGGRTTRGTRTAAESFAARLNALPGANVLTPQQRDEIAHELQRWLVARATAYLDGGRLEVEIVLTKPATEIVTDVLAAAAKKNISGPVAQHLVGAKLALRFPEVDIPSHSYTTADQQLGRHGDFVVGDTAIHVTVAPMQHLFERCTKNLVGGVRVLLLVPKSRLQGARENADMEGLNGRIDVAAIESFIGQNLDEMSGFSREGLREQIRRLFDTYNARVNIAETNPGLLIEIPEL